MFRRLSVDDIIAARERDGVPVRRSGSAYLTNCPAHPDRHPSLTFGEGENGTAWIRCFAACPAADVVRALAADGTAVPLDPAELARRRAAFEAERLTREARARERYALSFRHPHREEALHHVAPALRWDADDLLARGVGWNGARVVFPSVVDGAVVGVSMYAAPGTRARLEERPKMIAYGTRTLWPAPTADVELLVEGAPAAATLLSCGFNACAFPAAAGVRRVDAEQLRNTGLKHVLVLADADLPGRRGARTSCLLLREQGIRARAIDLFLTDDGRDVADEMRARADGADWLRAELEPFQQEVHV
jgi:hypothetical protein